MKATKAIKAEIFLLDFPASPWYGSIIKKTIFEKMDTKKQQKNLHHERLRLAGAPLKIILILHRMIMFELLLAKIIQYYLPIFMNRDAV